MAEITGVLLAAGFSSRFGSSKLLYDIDNQPLIARSAAALSPCDRVIAVVRADDTAVQSALHTLGIDCVINPQPERGIGHSIACAVQATSRSAGWCLLPADMPCIMASTTSKIVDSLGAGAALAAPFYHGQRGHPVAFSHSFADALSTLDGDTGARYIVEQNAGQLISIDTEDAGVLADIDTAMDLKKQRTTNNE